MEVQDKYLPTKEERIFFLRGKIAEHKKQMYGGVLEVKMADENGEKRTVKTTEDMMQQIMTNIDILQAELDTLEE